MDKIDAGILTDLHKAIVEIAEDERPSRYTDQELVQILWAENQELRQALHALRVCLQPTVTPPPDQIKQGG